LARPLPGKLVRPFVVLDNLRAGYGIILKLPERREVIPRFSGPASTLTIEEWNGLLREGPSKCRGDPDSILKPQPCWVEAF
jgi:hypothetical protein